MSHPSCRSHKEMERDDEEFVSEAIVGDPRPAANRNQGLNHAEPSGEENGNWVSFGHQLGSVVQMILERHPP